MVKYLVKEAPASFFCRGDLKNVIVLFTIINNLFIFTKLTKAKMIKKLFIQLLFIGIGSLAFSQEMSVTGFVKSEQNVGLPFVKVQVKGITTGVTTDGTGFYRLKVSDAANSTLVYTLNGYEKQEVQLNGRNTLDIVLVELVNNQQEVVVGYGTAKSKEVTGATSKVNGANIEKMSVARVDQALQGQVAGVNIATNSGSPGGSSSIRIRGLSTFGDNDPLILVDGVVYDSEGLNALNPSDIKSINVLKDATAGIYGVRAANGVIIVETKKGNINSKPQVEYNAYWGQQQTSRKLDLLTAQEYAVIKNEMFAMGGQDMPFNNTNLGIGTPWQDSVFQTAPIQSHNLSISGGTMNTRYSFPNVPIRKPNGQFSYMEEVSDIINPIAQMQNQYNWNTANKIVGKEEFVYEFNEHLSFTNRFNYNVAFVDGKVFSPLVWYGDGKYANTALNDDLESPTVELAPGVEINRGAAVYEDRSTFVDLTYESFLNYEKTFAEVHKIKGTAGVSIFQREGSSINGTAFGIPNNSVIYADISANTAQGGYLNNVGSWEFTERLVSSFLRAEYSFKEKYMFSGIVRRDGSSKFGANSRYGIFPTASAGWLMSEESFFKVKFIDYAKLRISYGVSGNDQIPNFAYRGLLNGEGVYVFDDLITQGVAIGRPSNPDLKWETTRQLNIGADFTFWKKLDFTTNYFIKNTACNQCRKCIQQRT